MELFQDTHPLWLIVFIIIAFIAGYIDAIAGGGGMLQIPVLLLGGLPPITALATNKFVSMVGTSFVVIKYALHRLIIWRYILAAIIPCGVASIVGSQLAIITPDWALEITILISIAVALLVSIYTRPVNQDSEQERKESRHANLSWLTGIALYDGFAGPGTGSFMALANNRTLGYNLMVSTAIAKPINLVTNISATFVFVYFDMVVWSVAIPMLLANALGGWVGGHFAISNGAVFIRKVLIGVLTMMLSLHLWKWIS